MTVKRLKLGIVGGLGARAGADILGKLVQFTPVRSESDHREILFEQKPLSEPLPVDSQDYNPTHRKSSSPPSPLPQPSCSGFDDQ
ncbi:MAG: hypothetical protein Q8O82_01965 [Pseudorhodobacter sp.]|nr:hypothetical protein [Pseudorhodobacter sp.]